MSLGGVPVDGWGYLTADYADLGDYADSERMELDGLGREVIGCAWMRVFTDCL